MGWVTAIVVLLVVATLMTLTGWGLSFLFGLRRLQRLRVENLLIAALFGTAFWILATGACQHLGFPARQSRWILFPSLLLPTLALLWKVKRWHLPRWQAPGTGVSLLGIAFVISTIYVLYPLRLGSVSPFNDTTTYLALSNGLQDHSFHEKFGWDPERPVISLIFAIYQNNDLRMGSSYLLALTQSCSPGIEPLVLFAALTAWAVVLNLTGIYLMLRWVIRSDAILAGAAALVVAIGRNPVYVTVEQGFQPQLYGTAYLLFLIALLSRSLRQRFWTRTDALLIGFAAPTFISAYSELAPIVVLALPTYFIASVIHARQRGLMRRFLTFGITTVLVMLVVGNIEWLRAFRAVLAQMKTTDAVGWRIPFTATGYWSFLMGTRGYSAEAPTSRVLLATGLATVLLLIGLYRCCRQRRTLVLTALLATFALIGIYYGACKTDPFTNTTGHRWATYKLCKWAFPFVVITVFAGIDGLSRARLFQGGQVWRRTATGRLAWVLLFLLPCSLLAYRTYPEHRTSAKELAMLSQHYYRSPNPVAEWNHLRAWLRARKTERVYYLVTSRNPHPHVFNACLFYPYPMVSAWKDYPDFPQEDLIASVEPGTIALAWVRGTLLDSSLQQLPANMVHLPSDRPAIVEAVSTTPPPEDSTEKHPKIWIGQTETVLNLWSPREGKAVLSFDVEKNPNCRSTLFVRVESEHAETLERPVTGMERIEVTLSLPFGHSKVTITGVGSSATISGEGVAGLEQRLMQMSKPSLRFEPTAVPRSE